MNLLQKLILLPSMSRSPRDSGLGHAVRISGSQTAPVGSGQRHCTRAVPCMPGGVEFTEDGGHIGQGSITGRRPILPCGDERRSSLFSAWFNVDKLSSSFSFWISFASTFIKLWDRTAAACTMSFTVAFIFCAIFTLEISRQCTYLCTWRCLF